jgi:hypothetical protein
MKTFRNEREGSKATVREHRRGKTKRETKSDKTEPNNT